LIAVIPLFQAGCVNRHDATAQATAAADRNIERARRDEALEYALNTLKDLEEYDAPEMFGQVIDRLDQWIHDQQPLPDWKVDPLVDTLPSDCKKLLETLALDRLSFDDSDQVRLREVVWLRNIAYWARGEAVDPLGQAEALFDWVVRNIQLEPSPPVLPGSGVHRVLHWPWEVLLFGRGAPTDRAWVYILLLRQLGIDGVMVGISRREALGGQRVDVWAVGVLVDNELYMFEPTLGLPIPGLEGPQWDPNRGLRIRPATLRQLAENDGLLRQLDLPELQYPVRAAELQKVVLMLEASPAYLSQKMRLLEARIAGRFPIVLTTSPSETKARLQGLSHVEQVILWPLPYHTVLNALALGEARQQWLLVHLAPFTMGRSFGSPLWKGRQYHFRGIFTGDASANVYYQEARAPDRLLDDQQTDPNLAAILKTVKLHASYWLGLIAAEQGNWVSAIDYFEKRTLEAFPHSPFSAGAIYNLARVFEASGDWQKAVETYKRDESSLGAWGNLLRAGWLEELHKGQSSAAGDASAPEDMSAARSGN